MTTSILGTADEMVTVLSRWRYGMLERANALLNDPLQPPITESDGSPSVASLLVAARRIAARRRARGITGC